MRRMKDLQDSYSLNLLHLINMVPSTLPVFSLLVFADVLFILLNSTCVNSCVFFFFFNVTDDDYYEDDEEDDPDALKDPIYQIDLQVHSF